MSRLFIPENKQKDESCLSQPNGVMWQLSGESAVLKCSVNSDCSAKGLQYEWFAFRRNVHLRLRPSNESLKYSLDGASLHIKSLHVNDSGIYHCAAVSSGEPAPGAQHVGLGTTLVVRGKSVQLQVRHRCANWERQLFFCFSEQFKTMVRHILWVSCVLLATYSLAILILMIKKVNDFHVISFKCCALLRSVEVHTNKAE
uniref:Ig-like domain-containing protein n=1 Tax=Cyclopterus lumpus TaxID=8103 RepID=A0A8C2ZG50_CYCLU